MGKWKQAGKETLRWSGHILGWPKWIGRQFAKLSLIKKLMALKALNWFSLNDATGARKSSTLNAEIWQSIVGFAVWAIPATAITFSVLNGMPAQVKDDIKLLEDIDALYDAIYDDSRGSSSLTSNISNKIMRNEDFGSFLILQDIESIELVKKADNSYVIKFNVVAAYDLAKTDLGEFIVEFALSEEQYNKLNGLFNVDELEKNFRKIQQTNKIDNIEVFRQTDFKALTEAIIQISNTIQGINPTIIAQRCELNLALNAIEGETTKSTISPVIEKYYSDVFHGNLINSTQEWSKREEFFNDAIKDNANTEHSFSYSLSEDGSYILATIETEVGYHPTLECKLKITNFGDKFNKDTIATILTNYFTGIEQDAVVELANPENAISNYTFTDVSASFVYARINNLVTLAKNDRMSYYSFIEDAENVTFSFAEDGTIISCHKNKETDTEEKTEEKAPETDNNLTPDTNNKEDKQEKVENNKPTDSNTDDELVEDINPTV